MNKTMGIELETTLNGTTIKYMLVRSKRRSTIGFSVREGTLTVRVPVFVSRCEIDQALQQYKQWIIKHISKSKVLHQAVKSQSFSDGAHLLWLGKTIDICRSAQYDHIKWDDAKIYIPLNLSEEKIAQRLESSIRKKALLYFNARCQYYSDVLQIPTPQVSLSQAKTRWGSCSNRGIRLNWRLMHLAPSLIDYVVAHECAHCLEMNHSAAFWALVERIYADYSKARKELRKCAAAMPQWPKYK